MFSRLHQGERAESPEAVRDLAGRWFDQRPLVSRMPRGGFSGDAVRVVAAGCERFVLKPFPRQCPADHARWVHAQMRRAVAAGVAEVPAVRATAAGDTVVPAAGRLWEMIAFVEGSPVTTPTSEQAAAAMRVLASIHGTVPGQPDAGDSSAIAQRVEAARRLLERPWHSLLPDGRAGGGSPLERAVWERLPRAIDAIAGGRSQAALATIAGLPPRSVLRQWVLRDVWHDHVLYDPADPDRVAGIVDYHASGRDTPATDVARLLGSWIDPGAVSPDWWSRRVAAYEAIRPLPEADRRLVPFLAATGVVFGLDHWCRWILEEDRQFGVTAEVEQRLDRLVGALPIAVETLGTWALEPV